jgi:murein DD-endopeptidase MepM/ murein hydrolase activator NlpD
MPMGGGASISARSGKQYRWTVVPLLVMATVACDLVLAQTLYKYRGPDGEWVFSDRPPDNDGVVTEQRGLSQRGKRATLLVIHTLVGNAVEVTARNGFYAPMEVAIVLGEMTGIEYPDPKKKLRWVIPANGQMTLLSLPLLNGEAPLSVDFKYSYLPGDPDVSHRPGRAYRAPFSVGKRFSITQAYPDAMTHQALDSRYAVDIAMPIGTDVVAARGGIVFDVAANNYRSGLDPHRDGSAANVIFILHDDGTFALYAHLNWNSIRVNPGDRVKSGEYIADSGNTGFSTGPHLHFAVQRNTGFEIRSLPVAFKGVNSSEVEPATGKTLTAYH